MQELTMGIVRVVNAIVTLHIQATPVIALYQLTIAETIMG